MWCLSYWICFKSVLTYHLLFQVIAEAVRTTLGPRGMDKLMVDGRGEERLLDKKRFDLIDEGMDYRMDSSSQIYDQLCFPGKATISNDGATILKLLDVVHPAAKTLVDIARSQDAEVRERQRHRARCCFFAFWTSPNTEDNLHCQNIITGFSK